MNKPEFRKSSACATSTCVEVAQHGDQILVRSSRDTSAPPLAFTTDEWQAFVAGVKRDEFRFE